MLAVPTVADAATCFATDAISTAGKSGVTASRADTARAFVKYRFAPGPVPSTRSLVVESATPFSAVIVRPDPFPVI